MSGSQECDINAAVEAGTDITRITVDSARAPSPLPDEASGRASDRTVDGTSQNRKVTSKGFFNRRRNTKDSKEGKEQEVSAVPVSDKLKSKFLRMILVQFDYPFATSSKYLFQQPEEVSRCKFVGRVEDQTVEKKLHRPDRPFISQHERADARTTRSKENRASKGSKP